MNLNRRSLMVKLGLAIVILSTALVSSLFAAFTGNSIYEMHGGDVPRTDIVENIKKLNHDLLFFSGDQVYDHKHHLA